MSLQIHIQAREREDSCSSAGAGPTIYPQNEVASRGNFQYTIWRVRVDFQEKDDGQVEIEIQFVVSQFNAMQVLRSVNKLCPYRQCQEGIVCKLQRMVIATCDLLYSQNQ